MNIYDVFKVNVECCGSYTATAYEIYLMELYETINPCLYNKFMNVTRDELYGKDGIDNSYNKIMDIHYVVFLVMMAWQEYETIYLNGEVDDETRDELWAKYHIDCIKTYLDCTGCSIDVLKAFYDKIEEIVHTPHDDGIGVMGITDTVPPSPVFRVRT